MSQVAIVVLNWNGWQDTLACLHSLLALKGPDFRLLVVDNGSTDDSVAHIKAELPDVELIQTGANLGFGGGCNVGIRQAISEGAEYVWLVNSDAKVDPAAFSALLSVAQAHPGVGAVGSVLYEMTLPPTVQLWGGGRVNLWLGFSRHQTSLGTVDFISGASLFLRCKALNEVGLFDDTRFFMYWEDADLAFRLRRAGWQLAVADESRLWHRQSASLGQNSPLLDQYFTQSAIRFFRRHALLPILPISLMLLKMLLKRLVMGNLPRVRAVLKGFRAA